MSPLQPRLARRARPPVATALVRAAAPGEDVGVSVRYLVTVDPDADTGAVEAALRDAGAESVAAPAPELPDVFIATVDESVADYADRVRGVSGVRVAERDAWVGLEGAVGPGAEDIGLMPVEEPRAEPPADDR